MHTVMLDVPCAAEPSKKNTVDFMNVHAWRARVELPCAACADRRAPHDRWNPLVSCAIACAVTFAFATHHWSDVLRLLPATSLESFSHFCRRSSSPLPPAAPLQIAPARRPCLRLSLTALTGRDNCMPHDIDILKIDIDCYDYDVVEAILSHGYRPKVAPALNAQPCQLGCLLPTIDHQLTFLCDWFFLNSQVIAAEISVSFPPPVHMHVGCAAPPPLPFGLCTCAVLCFSRLMSNPL